MDLMPRLPRSAWMTLVSHALSAVGTGMTMPFLIVYLHDVRGIAIGTAGLAAATVGVGALMTNLAGGMAIDRFGARAALIGGWSVAAAGTAFIAVVGAPWQAFAAAALAGVGGAVASPAQDALLARLAPRTRASAFAVRYAITNAGVTAGGLLAAVLVSGGRPASFFLLYCLDAGTYILAAVLVACIAVPPPAEPSRPRPEPRRRLGEGYREVAGDRLFRRIWVLTVLLVLAGYTPLISVFPVYVTESAGLGPHVVSIAFVANALTVALAQLAALRLLRGCRRTSVIIAACGWWATASCLTLATGRLGTGLTIAACVLAAVMVGIGETMLSPALLPMINDLAPEPLSGRYNAATSLAFTVGFTLGPALAGLMLQHGLGAHLIIGSIVMSGLAAILAHRLALRLPASANRMTQAPPATPQVSAL
ncbi:MFS transporter [Microbispora triticiradicis]|uniref:MFS transporter n=2 Tax=Microbispora TaxID=2005 RepID=A0ABY3LX28_9ACTN|nr:MULTISPECIES: MFS transporter [Microbispora]TLP66158.1 MFS transporter [Microbispora fusca]TYB58436.1 MFS transporter [Microbispora tritici]